MTYKHVKDESNDPNIKSKVNQIKQQDQAKGRMLTDREIGLYQINPFDPSIYYETRPAKVYYYPSDQVPEFLLSPTQRANLEDFRRTEAIYSKPIWPITSNQYEEMGLNRFMQ